MRLLVHDLYTFLYKYIPVLRKVVRPGLHRVHHQVVLVARHDLLQVPARPAAVAVTMIDPELRKSKNLLHII